MTDGLTHFLGNHCVRGPYYFMRDNNSLFYISDFI